MNDFRGFLDQLKELEVMEQKEITTLATEIQVCEVLERQLNEEKEKLESLQLKHATVVKKNAMKHHLCLELHNGIKGLRKDLRQECLTLVETHSCLFETNALLATERLVFEAQFKQMEEHKMRLFSHNERLALKVRNDQLEKEKLEAQAATASRLQPPKPGGKMSTSLQPKGSMWGSGRQQMEEALSKLSLEKLQLTQRVKEVEGENLQLKKEIDGMELQIKSMVDAIFGGEA